MSAELEVHQPSGVVGTDEVAAIATQAETLARTTIVPKQYRGKPDDIFAAAIMGAELGFGVFTSLRFVHVIDGKPEISSEGKIALARQAGHSVTGTVSATKATVTGVRRDTGDTMTVDYTIDDAKAAGLVGRGVWKQHPKAMLWARAVSTLMRRLFPDVTLGTYTLGELSGADTWEPGETRVVDADTGEIVEDPAGDAVVYADPDQVEHVRALIGQLEQHHQTWLREFMRTHQIPSLLHADTLPADALDLVWDEVRRLAEQTDNGPDRYDDPQHYDTDTEPF